MEPRLDDKIVGISEARRRFADLIRTVARGERIVSIAQDSRVGVSLVSREKLAGLYSRLEALENLLESYEILQDRDLMRKISRSEKNLKKGKGFSLEASREKMGL